MILSDHLKKQIIALLEKSGFSPTILSLVNCMNGGNNRGYLLETPEGLFFVKKYFRQTGDERDRLTAESAFLSYAQKAAPHFVPCSYGQDAENALALYEYLDGRPISSDDISEQKITQAIQFFRALNKAEMRAKASSLPEASDAAFSIQEHLNRVDARIGKLQQAIVGSAGDREAKQFMKTLISHWEVLLDKTQQTAKQNDIDLTAVLDISQRCISPSDFGFHNALKMADGSLRFLDFEYAGWDDPAKMVGDFFLQLAVPIPSQYYDLFLRETLSAFPQPDTLMQRTKLLHDICRVKWCCIALNVYIPVHLARRQFANPALDAEELKKKQLKKAEKILTT